MRRQEQGSECTFCVRLFPGVRSAPVLLSMYLLPALCVLGAGIAICLHGLGGSATSCTWHAMPLVDALLYLAYVRGVVSTPVRDENGNGAARRSVASIRAFRSRCPLVAMPGTASPRRALTPRA